MSPDGIDFSADNAPARRIEMDRHLRWFAVVLVALAMASVVSAVAEGASSVGARAAAAALRERGVPYAWGDETPRAGFDSSGLVVWAYAREGVALPHYPPALWLFGRHVARNALQIGDLVFFNGHAHVGIYVGRGEFVHAPRVGAVVRVDSVVKGFYAKHYDGAVRVHA
jgi:cell wall-associated NlpC family hydrolase